MYRVVSRSEAPDIPDHQPAEGEPTPQIINHRTGNQSYIKKQQSYESIKEQRDKLLESEFKYIKRIKELEKENEDLLKVYEPTYKENEQLKSHLMHGPESQTIKKLKQEKKKLLSELEIVNTENAELQDRIKELEKMFLSEKEYYLEKKWREAVEKGRKRREERDSLLSIQGPFATARKPKKKDLKSVTDVDFEKQDAHDLHIDTLEKETQILLNKIKRIKQNKESVDYAYFIGKGAITRNSSIAKAINEKLDKDLEEFENRLEDLRQKTKQLKGNSSEDLEIPAKKVRMKQSGNKYFRTRHTQTDMDAEKIQDEPDTVNESVDRSLSKASTETRKMTSKAKKKRHIKINSKSPDIVRDLHHESTFKHHSKHVKEVNHKLHDDQVAVKNASIDIYGAPEGEDSHMAEHWHKLAVKLNEAERLGGKTPFAYRSKTKDRASGQSSSSRIQESMSYVPKKMHTSRPNSEVLTVSAKSQRSTISDTSISTSKTLSSSLSNNIETLSEIDESGDEHIDDSMLDSRKRNDLLEPHEKVLRKTAENGVEVKIIPIQDSSETGKDVKYRSEQTGRYTNGFEPINRYKKNKKQFNMTNRWDIENNTRLSNERNSSEKQSGKTKASDKSSDTSVQQRVLSGESIKRSSPSIHSRFKNKSENSRDSQLQLKTGLTEENLTKATNPSSNAGRNTNLIERSSSTDDGVAYSRNISAYDEVLADVKKQYNDQERRQMFQLRKLYQDNDKTENDRLQRTRNINDKRRVELPHNQIEYNHYDRTEQDISARNGKAREYIYNLDLL